MGRLSDATMNIVLDLMFGDDHVAPFPASYDVALSTTQPTNTGTNVTEPDGAAGYARIEVTNDDTNWPPATARQKANGTAITFDQPTDDWGTVGWAAVYDHGTTTFRAWSALQTPRVINAASDPPRFPAGAFVLNGPGA